MATFVLIHGGNHGAWCWSRLIPELEILGHSAIAPDLPCEDPDAGFAEYATTVLEEMSGLPDADAVVVGHSLGAYTALLVAAARPVRRVVTMGAVPALGGRIFEVSGSILTDILMNATRFADVTDRHLFDPAEARPIFYNDCDDETASWALARLRPQGSAWSRDPWPLEQWPAVPRSLILGEIDNVVSLEPALVAARESLDGGEAIVIPGGHSPFLARPALFAELLVSLAES